MIHSNPISGYSPRTMPDMTGLSAILAHQGGWDEILLVLGPIILIVGILAVVKRRVDRMGPPPPPA